MAKCRNCGAELGRNLYDGLCEDCFYQDKGKSSSSGMKVVTKVMIGMGVGGLVLIIVGIYVSVAGFRGSVESQLASFGLTLAVIGAISFTIAIGYPFRNSACCRGNWCP